MNLPVLGTASPSQVALIVRDIETAKENWAAFLGKEIGNTQGIGDPAITKMEYMGERHPESGCKLAFFNMGNIQLELIEPDEGPSTWREFLDTHGEGLHHLGYNVEDIFKAMADMQSAGFKLTQFGYYGNGRGAYAYYDCTEKLKCYIELLCSFK